MDILKKVLYGVLFLAVFVGVWNLIDFVYCSYITRSGYAFSSASIIRPAVWGVVFYLVLFIFTSKRKNGKN